MVDCYRYKKSEGFAKDIINMREAEIKKVEKLYNFDSVHKLNLSTMRVDEYSMSDLIGKIAKVIQQVKPNTYKSNFKIGTRFFMKLMELCIE